MNYLILIVPLIITAMEFFLKPVDDTKKGIRKITLWGYIYIAFTLFLVLGMWNVFKEGEQKDKKIESLLTGGDSFPYAVFDPKLSSGKKIRFTIQIKGNYPLDNVVFDLYDVDATNIGFSKKDSNTVKNWNIFHNNVGTMSSGMVLLCEVGIPSINGLKERNFILNFGTKYANYDQIIKLRSKNNAFYFATQEMLHDSKNIIFDSIYSGFLNRDENKNSISWTDYSFYKYFTKP